MTIIICVCVYICRFPRMPNLHWTVCTVGRLVGPPIQARACTYTRNRACALQTKRVACCAVIWTQRFI